VREQERLFLLLALVLPRQRILEIAWSNARDAEDVRAYAMEMLDILLPTRQKMAVLRLLDETSEPRGSQSAMLDAFVQRLDAGPPTTNWIRCCALYAGQATNVLPPEATLRRWAASPDVALSGVARSVLGKAEPGGRCMLAVEKVMVLRSVDLFAGVPSQFLAAIAELLAEHEVKPGEIVIHEGEMGDRLYVIVRGSVEVTHAGRSIAKLGPGEVFGELAVLDPGPRAATVTAVSDGLLLSLDHEHVEYLIAGSIEIAQAFIRMLCRRVRETNDLGVAPAHLT
jgi:hypothetical protein